MSSRRNTELMLLIAAAFPVTLLYALYVVTTGTALTFGTLAVPLGLFAGFAAAHIGVRILAPGADPALLPVVFALSGVGITFVTRLNPDAALNQVVFLFVGIALMVGTLAVVKNLDIVKRYKYTLGLAGIILLILPIFIGVDRWGSKLWIQIGSFTIQPGEFAKVFIVLFLAGYLAENRELLSIANHNILGFKLPRLRLFAPLFVVWGVCLVIVAFERDLGSALLFYTLFLIMLYVATGRISYVVIGIALLAIGGFGAYQVMGHVQTRFQIWLDPFSEAQGSGYQLVQSLYSLADGGLVGTGIGKGMATLIPVVESDFIFSAIGEEMGLLGAAAVLLLFMLFAVRGLTTAARAKSDLAAFSATGLTAAISSTSSSWASRAASSWPCSCARETRLPAVRPTLQARAPWCHLPRVTLAPPEHRAREPPLPLPRRAPASLRARLTPTPPPLRAARTPVQARACAAASSTHRNRACWAAWLSPSASRAPSFCSPRSLPCSLATSPISR